MPAVTAEHRLFDQRMTTLRTYHHINLNCLYSLARETGFLLRPTHVLPEKNPVSDVYRYNLKVSFESEALIGRTK